MLKKKVIEKDVLNCQVPVLEESHLFSVQLQKFHMLIFEEYDSKSLLVVEIRYVFGCNVKQ